MNEQKLKPCPFCGGEAHCDRHDIFCDCGIKIEIPIYVSGSTSVGGFPTYEEAVQMMVEAWNDRADDNLINRQKAEIDRLKLTHALKIGEVQEHYRNQIGKARAEAIKEFAERLRNKFFNYYDGLTENTSKSNHNGDSLMFYEVADMIADCIDNLVEEMTEERK